jgi:hypothetical protein
MRDDETTHSDNLSVLPFDGEVEGRLEIHVLEVHVRLAVEDQLFGHLHVVVEGGEVEGSVAVVLFLVDDPRTRQLGQEDLHRAEGGNDSF